MSDVVERLRRADVNEFTDGDIDAMGTATALGRHAADLIEALAKEIERLRAALADYLEAFERAGRVAAEYSEQNGDPEWAALIRKAAERLRDKHAAAIRKLEV